MSRRASKTVVEKPDSTLAGQPSVPLAWDQANTTAASAEPPAWDRANTTAEPGESNLDFGALENADVLENFDFDSFLKFTADENLDFDVGADFGLYTISEDVSEGKTALKSKALKLLVKPRDFWSGFSTDSTTTNTNSLLKGGQAAANSHTGKLSVNSNDSKLASSGEPYYSLSKLPPIMSGTQSGRGPTQNGESHQYNHEPVIAREPAVSLPEAKAKGPSSSKKRKASTTMAHDSGKTSMKKMDLQQKSRPQPTAQLQPQTTSYSDKVRVIYFIHCPYEWSNWHSALAYEDVPTLTARDSGWRIYDSHKTLQHLNGVRPIHDLVDYLKISDHGAAVIVIRHLRCEENQPVANTQHVSLRWYESLAVKSPSLRSIISTVARCYYNSPKEHESGQKIIDKQLNRLAIAPIQLFLYHHIDLMLEYVNRHDDTYQYVQAIYDYSMQNYGDDFREAKQLLSQGRISQKHLDKLYLPNDIAVRDRAGSMEAFVVSSWPRLSYTGAMEIECWCWNHNGSAWQRKKVLVQVDGVSGASIEIKRLEVYPLKFADAGVRNTLLKRGQKLFELSEPAYISYEGFDDKHDSYYPHGSRFMISYSVYRKMHETAPVFKSYPPTEHTHDPWPTTLETSDEPDQEMLMVMPKIVHGFYFNEKQWVAILIDGVRAVTWNKTAYDRLVLPEKTKELVKALVTIRASQRGIKHGLGMSGKRVDIVAGKGNGLIMLLHGGPGTGKSLTAEGVAEIAEMPLYRVTCGDIGTTPEAVEKYMGIVMHLGVTWNCVLLLDEADVFLEERAMSDLARNSLVSVFLRILEYYDGILILTSNRIGTIDEAFKSRIQVALHYDKLTIPSRRKIWNNFLEMLEEDEEDADFEELRLKLDTLSKIDLNGRQIRNTMTTARQIAMYQEKRLEWSHLEQALAVSAEFNEYTRKVHGHTDEQRARDEKIR